MPVSGPFPVSDPQPGASIGAASSSGAPAGDGLLLAGDVGGTKTVLALVRQAGGAAEIVAEAVFPSREYASLETVLAAFRAAHPAPLARAAFSVAGPVIEGRADITNLPWRLDERCLAGVMGVERVLLVNDLQATAFAVPHLRPDQVTELLPGQAEPNGVRAVVSVGTGLGEALLVPTADGGFLSLPTEGGHTDFAPRGALQRRLLAELARVHDHVSYERVCSGMGIAALYRFLAARSTEPPPPWLAARLAAGGDVTPAIVDGGMHGERGCPVCRRTLRLLAAILGAEAGNAALRGLATGGVYLGGGIPPRILPVLRGRAFREGFRQKGPMSPLMENIPVHVILEPRAALLGAARYGMAMA
ncbi:glucokinase [Longimicrobium sp.]|uniref:glucokinase n=1 Tax=Longimicrobium sp. TaxID=2029185 RepID=UPI002E31D567|nr:glucokinase [Longimicrobium sp.]HEX6041818.1 glucokinase [Longimicrobium sp.]